MSLNIPSRMRIGIRLARAMRHRLGNVQRRICLAALLNLANAGIASLIAQDSRRTRDASFWARDVKEIRADLESELVAALLAQRAAWQSVEKGSHSVMTYRPQFSLEVKRFAYAHCHAGGDMIIHVPTTLPAWATANETFRQEAPAPYPLPTMIRAKLDKYAICPGWLPPTDIGADDSTHTRNGTSLTPAQILPYPASLITAFDTASRYFPEEPFFVGQLVRMLSEEANQKQLEATISRCRADRRWCALLAGYALAVRGDLRQADSVFRPLLRSVPTAERCAWLSVGSMQSGANRERYEQLPCDARVAIDDVMWWLATPLLGEIGNERRAMQLARSVRNMIVLGLPLDAQHTLSAQDASPVHSSLWLRYGAPTHLYWWGAGMDLSHAAYLGDTTLRPFTVSEYARDVVHLLPPLARALSPFVVTDSDFTLTGPKDFTETTWWPPEFYRHPTGMLYTLPSSQRALLRRDTTSLLIAATTLTGGALDTLGAVQGTVALAYSPFPDSTVVLQRQTARRGDRVVVSGELPGSGLGGLEFVVNANGLAGLRSRFGIAEAPTLAALPAGTLALSEPLLLDAAAITGAGVPDALRGLLGSRVLIKPTKVGLLWESYGFVPDAPVQIAVRVVRDGAISGLRRLGMALKLADDPSTSLSIAWTAPTARTNAVPVAGRVAAETRELVLDVSKLKAGEYVLSVTMQQGKAAPVESAVVVTIRR